MSTMIKKNDIFIVESYIYNTDQDDYLKGHKPFKTEYLSKIESLDSFIDDNKLEFVRLFNDKYLYQGNGVKVLISKSPLK